MEANMMRISYIASVTAFLAMSQASVGGVLPLPTSIVTLDIGNTQQSYNVSTPVDAKLTSGGLLASGMTILAGPPAVKGFASVSNISGDQATSSVFLQYYFSYSGPSNVQIPAIISTTGAVTTPLASANTAQVNLTTPLGATTLAFACESPSTTCDGGPNIPSFSIATPTMITSNTQYIIAIDLFLVANTFINANSAIASGFIDPVISIDPDFALRDEFTLELSPGVSNSAVPETPIWTMMLVGFAGLGFAAYRHRRTAISI
jgi:hypothetical protein